jgi:hypothetical protein
MILKQQLIQFILGRCNRQYTMVKQDPIVLTQCGKEQNRRQESLKRLASRSPPLSFYCCSEKELSQEATIHSHKLVLSLYFRDWESCFHVVSDADRQRSHSVAEDRIQDSKFLKTLAVIRDHSRLS